MRRLVIVLFGIFLVSSSYSQTNPIKIEIDVNKFIVDTMFYSQIDFWYSNNSGRTYVLWIEKNTVDSLSNFKRIQKHFYAQKGDMSLIQMIWDGNVESSTPNLFDTFMKIIKPKEKFLVSIIKKGDIISNSGFIKSIGDRIAIVKASEIEGL